MRACIFVSVLLALVGSAFAGVNKIPSDITQDSPMHAYSFVWNIASREQWVRTGAIDPDLGTEYGELPILWIASGEHRGAFIYPDSIPADNDFTFEWLSSFDIDAIPKAYSISVPGGDCIALLNSVIRDELDQPIEWEAPYFLSVFQNIMEDNVSDWASVVRDSGTTSFNWNTRLIIIPAFEASGGDGGEYIREIVDRFPSLGDALRNALENGATIYAEGNGGYLLEAYGIIPDGTVDITDRIDGIPPMMQASVEIVDSTHPLGFVSRSTSLYTVSGPTLSDAYRTILRFGDDVWDGDDAGKPAAIEISGSDAFGGKILLISAVPTAGALQSDDPDQWLWSANAIYSAFAHKMLYTRSVHSPVVLPESTNVAPFAIPADDSVTLEITVHLRNLWDAPITNIEINEFKSGYFYYVDCPTGPTPFVDGNTISWDISALSGGAMREITYRLRTPDASDPLVETINDYIVNNNYILPSVGIALYTDDAGNYDMEYRYDIWTMVLFQAHIIADVDLNWKNILGEYYQPFKIFMICENKERTSALNAKYVQYVPIDVPIYWVAPEVIPIIRTPGGQFVDVLQGNPTEEEVPVYHDIDLDGSPDAWLDFSSIHPYPTSIELTSIYWLNPWTDEYEDIDHDGLRAQDYDNDGIIDVDEPGDEIRAWRLEWDMNEIPGYYWYDPYVSWELWIDPPPLVDMAIGAAEHDGLDRGDRPDTVTGYYYPNWRWWMERDSISDEVIYVRLIKMSVGSYEGFRFEADTSTPSGLPPTDEDWGIIPYPRREYIAVLNLGGHEPTMTSPFPPEADTIYGKIAYETIWGKHRTTPIRVSYTYYAPLPNPLQFEYVAQTYKITDPSSGAELPFLPSNGNANIKFKVTASTEYSLYWLKNIGHDYGEFTFDYTDPEGRGWDIISPIPDGFGDGVFGYITVTIPKGIGGYEIDLPRFDTGEIDWSQLFPEFYPLVTGDPLVPETLMVLEYPFKYELYCPQIMIPPALDDDNFDGTDDWQDDFGDRFVSPTGYLHDIFPPLDGEDAEDSFAVSPWDTSVSIEGDLAHAHTGWSPGADGTYGDDLPEKLGATHLTLNVVWRGEGYEGVVKINEGATLVNEEIFGGSPWVQWTHTLLAEAKGNNLAVGRNATPTVVSLYEDTVYLRYRIYDWNEPHYFDENFDPYVISTSDGFANVQLHIGGKEPASLFTPDISTGSRIDLASDAVSVSIISAFPETLISSVGYTRDVNGAVLTAIVEVDNASGQTWDDVTCRPVLSELGSTEPFFWYGVYPRPFVPAHYDPDSGEWLPGDDPRTFNAGWRFNPSEREVLFKLGNTDGSVTIPEVQSSRRVYFIFHFVVDPALSIGVHDITFEISGSARDYWDDVGGGTPFTMDVPKASFAIVNWSSNPSPTFVLGTANILQFQDTLEDYFWTSSLPEAKWSWSQPDPQLFDMGIYSDLSGSFSDGVLTLDPPSEAVTFPPSPSRTSVWFIVRSFVDAPAGDDEILISSHPFIRYEDILGIERTERGYSYYIAASGPKVVPLKRITQVNGEDVDSTGYYILNQGDNEIVVELNATNIGNTIATQPKFYVQIGQDAYFDGIDSTYSFSYDPDTRIVEIDVGDIYPGTASSRTIPLWLAVPTVSNDEVLELCYAFTAEFYGFDEDWQLARTTVDDDSRKFTEVDPETLYYGANLFISDDDVSLSNDAPNIGEQITITAQIHFEGNTKFEQVPVRLLGKNGTPIGDDQIIPIFMAGTPDSIASVAFAHTVSDYYEKMFVVVDPDSAFGEISETDNVATVEITTGKGDLVKDVVNYPNPFKNYTEFVYTLTRPAKLVRVEVYTLRGRMVRTFDCPTNAGYNSVGWNGFDADGDPIANGSYIYKLIAEDFDGERMEIRSVAVRMQ